MIFARKINKIAEFYMIFARKMSAFYIIIARKYFPQILGGKCPLASPVLRLWGGVNKCALLTFNIQNIAHFVRMYTIAWNQLQGVIAPLSPLRGGGSSAPEPRHHYRLASSYNMTERAYIINHFLIGN